VAVLVPDPAGAVVVGSVEPDLGGVRLPVPEEGGPVATGLEVEPEDVEPVGNDNVVGAAAVWKLSTAARPATVVPMTIVARLIPAPAIGQKANDSR
jgi:hypothetical protein